MLNGKELAQYTAVKNRFLDADWISRLVYEESSL